MLWMQIVFTQKGHLQSIGRIWMKLQMELVQLDFAGGIQKTPTGSADPLIVHPPPPQIFTAK